MEETETFRILDVYAAYNAHRHADALWGIYWGSSVHLVACNWAYLFFYIIENRELSKYSKWAALVDVCFSRQAATSHLAWFPQDFFHRLVSILRVPNPLWDNRQFNYVVKAKIIPHQSLSFEAPNTSQRCWLWWPCLIREHAQSLCSSSTWFPSRGWFHEAIPSLYQFSKMNYELLRK